MADSQALPETQLAAEINDQPKQKVIITFMDAEWYNAAAEDQIDKFKDYTEPLDLLRNPKKNTVLHVYITAVKKETEESIEFVKLVISKCPPLLDEPNIRGETPLHIAARFGYNNIVEFLIRNIKKAQYDDLERGAEESTSDKMLKKTSPNGGTDLHEAVRNNHPRVVETLIRENLEFANIANAARESPLYVAAVRESNIIAFRILEICPSSAAYAGPNDRTALHEAVISEDTEYDKSAAYIGYKVGKTPLHIAILIGDKHKDEDGNTPIHLLATHDFYAGNLIQHHTVDKMIVNKENLTALDVVVATKNESFGLFLGSTAKHLKKAGYKRGRHSIRQAPPHNMSTINRELMSSLRKASESHQTVATLIATVTFVAGFTLPGGYSGQDGPDEGTAILTRKSAFKTFLVTDTIAQPKESFVFYSFGHIFFTVVALALMVVAFMTGEYAVLPHSSSGLGAAICVIGSCLALLCCWVLKAALCE
ncbi:protein ACCELERATED CELL DEATH 6-like [Hevea brasiliensis]|uniref:protein ACCELERATED CELL DEATH 6-like n=1 Tax=Hevea brasiliensis TaxID=3981 RepID=UPI0025E04DCA|nr:protein ACCELERATED CELL DEATH 6-like [Hevea brasiliensis]